MNMYSLTARLLPLITGILIAGQASLCRSAHADLTYSMLVGPSSAAMSSAPPIKTTVYLKGSRKRVDMTVVDRTLNLSETTITCPDLGEVVTIDSNLNIYKVEPIHTVLQMLAFPDLPVLVRAGDADHWSSSSGTSISAEGGGSEIVDGVVADHLTLTVHDSATDNSDTAGDVAMDYWVAGQTTGYGASVSQQIKRPDGSTLTYSITGDHTLIDELTQKLPVRVMIHSPGREDTQMDLTSYSAASISSSLFERPAYCQLVSPDQYEEREQAANPNGMELSVLICQPSSSTSSSSQ